MNEFPEGAQEQRVSIDDALKMAVELLQANQLAQGEYILETVLGADPDNPSAVQFLGITRYKQGRESEAIDLLARATTLLPDSPGAFMNYGNVLVEAGKVDEAILAYERMLKLAPENAPAWNNMGVLMRAAQRPELAEEALRKALELDPQDAAAYHNLGNLLLAVGRVEESVQCGLKAVTMLGDQGVGRKLLGLAYAYLGETEKAIAVYKEWLEAEPDNPTALHHLAALEGRAPERAPDAYVEEVFDAFAASFDAKLAALEYRAPELVREALLRELGPVTDAAILDLGCGTGLCGPLLRDNASRIVGVDLSGKMLSRAADRNVYDALEKAEFIEYLTGVTEPYDAIIAADALCYVGPVEAFCANALTAMRPGGAFVGSFEADADEGAVTLTNSGRYTHGADYLRRTFTDAGFESIDLQNVVLRQEQGKDVVGWLVSARRPA